MKVHIVKPYSIEKNLGKAYNEAMRLIPDGDWACLMDYDTMFLTPDCGQILHEYVNWNPTVGIFTCFTNRVHPLAKDQLLDGFLSDNVSIDYHIERAYNQKRNLFQVTEIKHEISGFLMMVSKKTWNEIKFSEYGKCLGVDNDFSTAVLQSGRKIMRMDGLYVFHTYRMKNGIKDKTHLV
jgi:GT2 family glycosyltransferase